MIMGLCSIIILPMKQKSFKHCFFLIIGAILGFSSGAQAQYGVRLAEFKEFPFQLSDLNTPFPQPPEDATKTVYFSQLSDIPPHVLMSEEDMTEDEIFIGEDFLGPGPVEGIQERMEIEARELKLFPNPTRDFINVKYSGIEGFAVLTVHDGIGKLLFRKEFRGASESSFQIDVSQYAQGVYMVSIAQDMNRITRNFIKK